MMICGDCSQYREQRCWLTKKDVGFFYKSCEKFEQRLEPLKILTEKMEKKCTCCGEYLPISEFKKVGRGYASKCNKCTEAALAAAQEVVVKADLEAIKDVENIDIKEQPQKEAVNHPEHYQFPNGSEALDIARYLSFNLGNAVKYIARAGRKDATKTVEDLKKAVFYLEDEIKRLDA